MVDPTRGVVTLHLRCNYVQQPSYKDINAVRLRDAANDLNGTYKTIPIASPRLNLPIELEKEGNGYRHSFAWLR